MNQLESRIAHLESDNRMLVSEVRYASEVLGAVAGVFEPHGIVHRHVVSTIDRLDVVVETHPDS